MYDSTENFSGCYYSGETLTCIERFQEYIKHKRKELMLRNFIVRLRIEEDNQKFEKRSNKDSYEAKVNVIEDSKGKLSTFKGLKQKKTVPG